MPEIAAPNLPSIAQFLAIGAPVAADAAVSADFAALLAQQIVDMPQPAAQPAMLQTGKALPAGRQDLAALPLPALILPGDAAPDGDTDRDIGGAIDGDLDEDETEVDASADLPRPEMLIPILAMLTQPAPIRVELRAAAVPVSDAAIAPAPHPIMARMPAAAPIVLPTDIALPTMGEVAPIQATSALPTAPMQSIAFVMRADATAAPLPVVTLATAPAAPVEPTLETPKIETDTTDASPRERAPARFAPQPVAEARNAAFALHVDPAAEPASSKPRTRTVESALAELTAMPGTASHEVRAVAATSMAATVDTLPRERATALVETIATLRSEAKGDTLNLAIQHDDFGPISIRFKQSDDSVVVQFDTRDADLMRLIADATPELKSAGEQHGMRFERRDTMNTGNGASNGTGTSGSHDAPRQGREQPRAETYQRPQSRQAQDRAGIFA